MARKLIAITDDAELQPTISATLGFRFLLELVREHLGPEASALLAEPQPIQNEGRRQWMTEAALAAPTVRLGDAPPELAYAARNRLAEVRHRAAGVYRQLAASTDVASRQRGAVVLRAFEVPNDDRDVWLVGGKPVLVGWGHIAAHAKPLEIDDLVLRFQKRFDPLPGQVVPIAPLPLAPPPPPIPLPPPAPTRRFPAALWWLLLLLLLILAGLYWLWSRPPPRPVPPRPPPVTPGPPQPPACVEAGCEGGQLQITLLWETQDDLDLYVDCPGGTIYFEQNHRTGCGDGKLDVDAQADRKMQHPVENVRWQQTPPNGRYRVRVKLYKFDGQPRTVPFELQVRLNDELRSCRTQLSTEGTETRVITFDLPGRLPACDRLP